MDLISFHTPDRAILSFFAVLVVIAVGPWLAERVRLPGLLGLLFGGLLIGPYVLGIVQQSDTFIKSLGTIGLLYLMYLAGLDLDLEILRRYKGIAITFAIITFVFPMTLGFLTGLMLDYKAAAAILLGSIWASHTLLTYPTFRRYGLANQRAVAVTVGATVITDTLALIVLAAVSGYATGDASGIDLFFQITLGLLILAAYCFLALPRLVRWLMPSLGQPPAVRYIIALAALFSAVVVCEMFGIDGIVGAFFAGLALNPLIPKAGPLFEHIEFFGSALFIPMFLVSVGLIIEPKVMADPTTLGTAAVFAISCIGGKAIASSLCRPIFKYSWNEVGAVFALSVNQAAATLAATFVGYEIGLFGTTVVNAVLIVIVISVIIGSLSAARFAPRLPVPPIDTSRLGRRVMVVVDDATDSVPETELAGWLAKADSGHVVPVLVQLAWEGSVAESRVEALNESLAGRGFDTEVVVRVDRSAADAVANASVGQKATIAIVPIDPPGIETAIFGADEDRLMQMMAVPVVFALLERTPSHIVLALTSREVQSPTVHVQVAFDLAARLVKAGRSLTVITPVPLPRERMAGLSGAHVVLAEDRLTYMRDVAGDGHHAALVAAPPGRSVLGADIDELARVPDTGLLIAVSATGDDAAKLVTIGRNLAAGRPRSA